MYIFINRNRICLILPSLGKIPIAATEIPSCLGQQDQFPRFLGCLKSYVYAETIYGVFIFRQFKLSCKAVGVHPPLELSHSLVQFAATALNDVSTATLYVINSHVSLNRFTHAVPRIGKGQTAPVGPTSFEFHVPESSPVTVMPSVGTVLPGKVNLLLACQVFE